MTKKLLTILALSTACSALVVRAQGTSSSGESSGQMTGPSKNYEGDWSSSQGHRLSATGHMMHQEVRATKVNGCIVQSSSGQTVGTIADAVINPASGRVDFAVISLSPSSSSATTPITPASGQLVAVPWGLLRPAGPGESETGTPSANSGMTMQPSFLYTGDMTKLQSAPSFSPNNWPDISQPTWRQSVLSHYGLTPGSPTGGAESPGSSSTGRAVGPPGSIKMPPQPPQPPH